MISKARRSHTTVVLTGVALVSAVCSAAVILSAAQRGGRGQAAGQPAFIPASTRPIARTSWDGKPDMTGVWGGPLPAQGTPDAGERTANIANLAKLYQPWAKQRSDALPYNQDPRLHCGPYGFPRYIGLISLVAPRNAFYFLLQIVQAPKQVAVLIEYIYSGYRIIPTEGGAHPKTFTPSYFGDSAGHWEGDTLVVDVTGFNGKIWVAGNLGNRPAGDIGGGSVSSGALHVVERWRMANADTLEYQATVEDPKVLTGSWTTPKYLIPRAAPDAVIHEALCIEPEDLGVINANAAAEGQQQK